MPKYCFNYDSGNYEWIEENGYSIDQGAFVYNWDDSEYRREEKENQLRQEDLWNEEKNKTF